MRRCPQRRKLVRTLTVLLSVAVTFLIAEICAYSILPRLKNPALSLQGLYIEDDRTGYRLARNWSGFYDDGEVRCPIRTNSLGDRDDEPTPADSSGLLLIGDSYTFGFLLGQEETIDRQIERISAGRVRAYNSGVPGYGPLAIREQLRRCNWFCGPEIIYLFFNNDLRSDNLEPDMGLTAFDGFMVPRRRPDGSAYTESDLRTIIAEIMGRPTGNDLESFVKLRNLRRAGNLLNLRERMRRLLDPERALLGTWPGTEFRPENVATTGRITAEMNRIAASRGQRFRVVVVPSVGEIGAGRHARLSEAFIANLREMGIEVILMLDHLSSDDFHRHNMHLKREGATVVARVILEAIDNRAGSAASP